MIYIIVSYIVVFNGSTSLRMRGQTVPRVNDGIPRELPGDTTLFSTVARDARGSRRKRPWSLLWLSGSFFLEYPFPGKVGSDLGEEKPITSIRWTTQFVRVRRMSDLYNPT